VVLTGSRGEKWGTRERGWVPNPTKGGLLWSMWYPSINNQKVERKEREEKRI